MVFKLDDKLLRKKIQEEINIKSLNNELDFNVKPFSFKNYSKEEVDKFLSENKERKNTNKI